MYSFVFSLWNYASWNGEIFFTLPLYSLLSTQCFDLSPELWWWSKSPLEMEAALISQMGGYLYSRESGWHLGMSLYLEKIL